MSFTKQKGTHARMATTRGWESRSVTTQLTGLLDLRERAASDVVHDALFGHGARDGGRGAVGVRVRPSDRDRFRAAGGRGRRWDDRFERQPAGVVGQIKLDREVGRVARTDCGLRANGGEWCAAEDWGDEEFDCLSWLNRIECHTWLISYLSEYATQHAVRVFDGVKDFSQQTEDVVTILTILVTPCFPGQLLDFLD